MYIGLDLGTSGLKALLASRTGEILGSATAHYDVEQPFPDWSEQDPEHWIDACLDVFEALRNAHPDSYKNVKAISFSGHMHGAVVVDKAGKPIRPCILWNDMRSHEEAAQLDAISDYRALSGNIVFPGFTAPKLLWIKNNEPENFAKIAKVLLPKDYLAFWMSGVYATDMSDASGTSWLNVAQRSWGESLLQNGDMTPENMPELYEGSDVIGTITSELAEKVGLSHDVKIVAGGADNAVAACGVGAYKEGQGFVSLGTSGVILAAKDEYAASPETAVHAFCHAIPERWYQMGVMLSATNSLNWLAATLGKEPAEIAQLCQAPVNGPSSVIFLPYLTGERTPHNDANIGGAFIGLKADTSPAELCQAVMEGVSFGLRDCLEALKSTGTALESVLVIGGGSKSKFWLETLANILNLRLDVPKKGEFGAALGAARLAMIGDGADIAETLTAPEIDYTVEPQADLVKTYDTAYERYRALYPLLKQVS